MRRERLRLRASEKKSAKINDDLPLFFKFLEGLDAWSIGYIGQKWSLMGHPKEQSSNQTPKVNILDVCDAGPYEFNTIIRVFRKSGIRPSRPVISVPLFVVWLAARIAGIFFSNKREWIHACYGKLASDLIFDNTMMMKTGFRPKHSLETIMGDRKLETGGWKNGK